jgi:hypothetical protein
MSNQKQPVSAGSRAILAAWLIAGTLDICCAMLWSYLAQLARHTDDANPLKVLGGVGGVALGKEFSTPEILANNTLMCIIGLIVHYAIALGWTLLFFGAWPRIKFLQGDKIVAGLVYGLVVWAVMTLAIVPLRVMHWGPFVIKNLFIGASIIMLAIGLPISIIIGNYYQTNLSTK